MKLNTFDWKILKSEKASGFVETLIAILVAGIGCAALLSLSTKVIRQVKENEIRDAMTQVAVEGLEEVRNIALTSYESIPDLDTGDSYFYVNDNSEFVKIDPSSSRCSENLDNQAGVCNKESLDSDTPDFFYREIKMNPSEVDSKAIEVTVEVGRFTCPNYAEADSENRCNTSIKGFIYGANSFDLSYENMMIYSQGSIVNLSKWN